MDRSTRLYRLGAALPEHGFTLDIAGETSTEELGAGEYWGFFPTGACTLILSDVDDEGSTFEFPLTVGVTSMFLVVDGGTITVAPIDESTGTLYVFRMPVIDR